ncbi:hypothetical protein FPZ24_10385 [Sphingomonas panacisoli]|uniref:Uncharacterized protein n=1 Tax=Sphingomonas panacisoli TaxID=1813879 RepID=A0A5B8LIF0_9SPHN|nr:hypothetical protein [Sphingomonas panacisoli]QDZ07841.1 hypothetical protein FPZ24_10385 [Sphingomonas panacisoli]
MAFREKIVWAAFVTTLLVWGSYFAVVIYKLTVSATHDMLLFWLFIAATVAQAAMMAATAAIAALMAPGDAAAPPDERDRMLGQRASGVAYFVVLLAIVAVIVWMHVGLRGVNVIFALIGVFILGEAVRFGTKAIGYRTGS